MRRIRRHLTFANVASATALFVVLGGTAYAATGDNFILGQLNFANSRTSLTAGVAGGNTLRVTNPSPGAAATALGLNVASGHPPFKVNSGTKVADLNADKLDGLDSTGLIRGRMLNKTLTRGAATFTKLATVGPYDINGRCLAVGTSGTRVRISARGPAGTAEAMFNSTVGNSDDGTEARGLLIPANVDTEFASSRTVETENFVRIGGTAMLISGEKLVQVDFHGVADNRTGSKRCLVYGTATIGT
jgi:hypothetical protein